ncbi:hypothetical protein C8R44DRAFT_71580 [Mycena epipterygia]|nr:hypothetical protein C8R44DRAFT_71580 [Mycena epipterygia]
MGAGVFKDTPVLRQLTLVDNVAPSFVPLSWQHLTIFRSGILPIQDCLEVLRSAPLLTDCTFCISQALFDFGSAQLSHGSAISSHPCLQVLSLVEHSDQNTSADIFKHITLSSLHTLRIAGVVDLDDKGSLREFIARSSPPLRTFSLHSSLHGAESASILESLRCMVTLTDLDLRDMEEDVEEDILGLLATQGRDFLPALQNLVFLDCISPGSGYAAMSQYLCSRWSSKRERLGVAALRSFKVIWPEDLRPYFDRGTASRLKELASAGASIHIGPAEHNHFTS